MAQLMPMLLATGATLAPEEASAGLQGLLADTRRNAQSFFAGAYEGPVHHSHAFLAVGHDGAAGRILFEDDTAAVHPLHFEAARLHGERETYPWAE